MRVDDRRWATQAIAKLQAEFDGQVETPLLRFPLPDEWGIDLYLKDESRHPSGSLKHRLAHSLLLLGLVNGDVTEKTCLVEASSGSTAVSEAYFAKLLGLQFVAVVPASTSHSKVALIESFGAECRLVNDANQACAEALRLGSGTGWFNLDQFTNASIATDWRGPGNIAHEIFEQLTQERFPEPSWFVVGAGTGGTSATIGRYCRYRNKSTRVALVDPEGSAFGQAWAEDRRDVTGRGSRIEGIGRPRVEPSFIPGVISDVIAVKDAASIAGMRLLNQRSVLQVGASTGTNLYGSLRTIANMLSSGQRGSVVTLICDGGERYPDTYYSEEWLGNQQIDSSDYDAQLREFLSTGVWSPLSTSS